jgi:hypothetical protein
MAAFFLLDQTEEVDKLLSLLVAASLTANFVGSNFANNGPQSDRCIGRVG